MCGTCGCADPANEIAMTDETGARRVLRAAPAGAATPAGERAHGQAAGQGHGHAHAHDNGHAHAHGHGHGHGHGHDNGHGHDQRHGDAHEHGHGHDHHHLHDRPHVHAADGSAIPLEVAVLAANDRVAARNRGWFEGRGVTALNFVSSPGAGKTALLERTIRDLAGAREVTVIEGDQMTENDALRIRAAGARAVQINTGAGCHLEADMVAEAAKALDPRPGSLLFIENVGNLVCPAMFDLGERMKIVVFSVTEGEDKPLKYPHMFRAAEVVLISKTDLAPHVDFDEDACRANIATVNPAAAVLSVSARTGAGMAGWLALLAALDAVTHAS